MNNENLHTLQEEVTGLLKQLIATPSFSKEEDKTAGILESFLKGKGFDVCRKQNNVWSKNRSFDSSKPTILLNSHHDTVKPNKGYTLDPFTPSITDGKLFG